MSRSQKCLHLNRNQRRRYQHHRHHHRDVFILEKAVQPHRHQRRRLLRDDQSPFRNLGLVRFR